MLKSLTSSVVRRASTSLHEASWKISEIYHSNNNSSSSSSSSNNINISGGGVDFQDKGLVDGGGGVVVVGSSSNGYRSGAAIGLYSQSSDSSGSVAAAVVASSPPESSLVASSPPESSFDKSAAATTTTSKSGSYLSLLKGVIGKTDKQDKAPYPPAPPAISSSNSSNSLMSAISPQKVTPIATEKIQFKVNVVKGRFGLGLDLQQGITDDGMIVRAVNAMADDSPHPCLVCHPAIEVDDKIVCVNGRMFDSFDSSVQCIKDSGQNVEFVIERVKAVGSAFAAENSSVSSSSSSTPPSATGTMMFGTKLHRQADSDDEFDN